MASMRKFWKETVAQDLVEYALIIAVIALGCIPVVSGVRYALATLYGRQADTIHQNLATPQQPATATKGVPIVGPSPADAAPDTSSGLNKGLMATVYWAIQRFVRFVGLIVI